MSQEKPKEEFSKVELDYLVQQSDNPEVQIFHNALDLALYGAKNRNQCYREISTAEGTKGEIHRKRKFKTARLQ